MSNPFVGIWHWLKGIALRPGALAFFMKYFTLAVHAVETVATDPKNHGLTFDTWSKEVGSLFVKLFNAQNGLAADAPWANPGTWITVITALAHEFWKNTTATPTAPQSSGQ